MTLASFAFLSLLPQSAIAIDHVAKGTFSNLVAVKDGAPLLLSLRTDEGLVHFAFRSQLNWSPSPSEQHLQGYRRTRLSSRASMQPEPASMSIVGSEAVIYFHSPRRRKLSLARLSIHRALKDASPSRPVVTVRRIFSYRGSAKNWCGTPLNPAFANENQGRSEFQEQLGFLSSLSTTGPGPGETAMPLVPPRIVTIATHADGELASKKGTATNSYIRTVLNAVDALYSTQLGIRLRLIQQEIYPAGSFVGNTADDVLESFRLSTLASATSGEADVHHLFSGRDFLGSTIGLAFVGTACGSPKEYNFSLSQSVNEALAPILVAHEIAHNLNATHDPTPGSIMNPNLIFTDRVFSMRSLAEIGTFVSQLGSCLTVGRLIQLTLNTTIDQNKAFSATATASSALSTECTLKLYGARTRSSLSTPTRAQRDGRLLLSESVSFNLPYALRTVTISSPGPVKPSGAGRFFFRSGMVCPVGSSWSSITEVVVPGALDAGSRNDRWLAALAKGMSKP